MDILQIFAARMDPGPDPVTKLWISSKSETEHSNSIIFTKGRSSNPLLSPFASKKIFSTKNFDKRRSRWKTEATIFFRVRRSKRIRWKRFGKSTHRPVKKVLRNFVEKKNENWNINKFWNKSDKYYYCENNKCRELQIYRKQLYKILSEKIAILSKLGSLFKLAKN